MYQFTHSQPSVAAERLLMRRQEWLAAFNRCTLDEQRSFFDVIFRHLAVVNGDAANSLMQQHRAMLDKAAGRASVLAALERQRALERMPTRSKSQSSVRSRPADRHKPPRRCYAVPS